MKLKSSAFDANDLIAAKYTCDGEDISPSLLWDAVPIGTESIVLIVDDPDAPGQTFVHWVVYDIPATVRQLPEHIVAVKTLPNGGLQGKKDFGKFGYGGIHRYFFKIYAIDKKLDLAAGGNKSEILTTAELIGRYKRQS